MKQIVEDEKILELVNNYKDAEIYHHPCWKMILEEIFGFKSISLATEDAYMPFMYLESSLFSNKKAVSLPIVTSAGLLGNQDKLQFFLDYLKEKKFKKTIIKQFANALFEDKIETSHAEYRKELKSEEDIWRGLNKGKKSNVNSAKKQNYKVAISKGQDANIDRFYPMYLKRMREFGTPPLPKEMFIKLRECFKDKFDMFEIYGGDDLIGVTICIGFKDIYYYIYVAFDTSLTKKYKHVQVYMIYQMMLEGLNLGYKYFSFGRSTKDSSQAKTKRYMGADEIDIYTYNINLMSMKVESKIQNQKDFELAITLWKMLPLKLTEFLGKPVRKLLL